MAECEPIWVYIGKNGGRCVRCMFSTRRVSGDRVDRTYSEGCCTRCNGPLSLPTRRSCYTTYRLGGARRTPATSSVSTTPKYPQSTYDDNSPRDRFPTNCCNRLKRRYETQFTSALTYPNTPSIVSSGICQPDSPQMRQTIAYPCTHSATPACQSG